jgi:hypothetical protein
MGALFSNLGNAAFWSGTAAAAAPGYQWYYNSGVGLQNTTQILFGNAYALAVSPGRAGQAPAVPLPGSAWLLGSSLLGLAGVMRRRASSATTTAS